jgi:hypothetical protein
MVTQNGSKRQFPDLRDAYLDAYRKRGYFWGVGERRKPIWTVKGELAAGGEHEKGVSDGLSRNLQGRDPLGALFL